MRKKIILESFKWGGLILKPVENTECFLTGEDGAYNIKQDCEMGDYIHSKYSKLNDGQARVGILLTKEKDMASISMVMKTNERNITENITTVNISGNLKWQ